MSNEKVSKLKDYMGVPGNYYRKAHTDGHKSQKFFYISREEFLVGLLKLPKNACVLDIGCGSGDVLEQIGKKFPTCKLYGCDLSEEAIKFCRSLKIKNAEFAVGTLEKIPFKGKKFDAIILSHVIEHVEKPEQGIANCSKRLKQNGQLIITTPNYASLWGIAEFVFDKTLATKGYSLHEQHIFHFTPWMLRKMLERKGLVVEKLLTLYMFSLPVALISRRLAEVVFEIDKAFVNLPINMIIYSVAVKK